MVGNQSEIAGVVPKNEVREKQRAGNSVQSELVVQRGRNKEPTHNQSCPENNTECGQNSSRPAGIEIRNAKAARCLFIENKSRNQKAADNKKHVDADKSAGRIQRK